MLYNQNFKHTIINNIFKNYFNIFSIPFYKRLKVNFYSILNNDIFKIFNFKNFKSVTSYKNNNNCFFINRYLKRIIVSIPHIKYALNKITITIYVYNREKIFFLKKLDLLNELFKFKSNKNRKKINYTKFILKKNNLSKKFLFNGILMKLDYKNNNVLIKLKNLLKLKILLSNMNNRKLIKYISYNKYIIKILYNILISYLKKNYLYKYYTSKLFINNFKFNYNNLSNLKKIIYKLYKKKINLNIINLNYMFLENNVFISSIINKLNDRKINALKAIRLSIKKTKLAKLNSVLLNNKKINKNILAYNNIINNFLSIDKYKFVLNKTLNDKYINIFNKIKNKYITGIKIETKGRLTKRLTASRSIFKLNYKGSLKNINSSFNNLSSVINKGYEKSNISFLKKNSNNRNGSYGIKYWISSY